MGNETTINEMRDELYRCPRDYTERPLMHLRQLMQRCPNLSELVNVAMAVRDKIDRKYWPDWRFIPLGVWVSVVHTILDKDYHETQKGDALTMRLSIVGTWRYGQGVYVFEPEIFNALIDSDIPDKLPSNVLLRLPEWCIYVPTPGFEYYNFKLYGFFASLNYIFKSGSDGEEDITIPCLYLTMDTNRENLLTIPIPLDGGSLLSALEGLDNTTLSWNADTSEYSPPNDIDVDGLAKEITPLISLLLYRCGDVPEIDNRRKPGTSPYKVQGRKIKGAYKIFPAANPTMWMRLARCYARLATAAAEANPDITSGRIYAAPIIMVSGRGPATANGYSV